MKNYDETLAKIDNLRWLPWIGNNYSENDKKLLIVGESHYTNAEDSEEYIRKLNESSQDKNYTRNCIQESAINNEWYNPTYQNINRTLVRTNNFDRIKLWSNIAYYNFIQRLMDYRKRERPNGYDFYNSWNEFIEIVRVLEPSDCIFIGVNAANSFNAAMNELNIEHEKINWMPIIGNTYPRIAKVIINKKIVKIHFIKHSSQMFSWSSWNSFLVSQSPELMHMLFKSSDIKKDNLEKDPKELEEISLCKKIPTHLMHKPIIACNYTNYLNDNESDAKYLSIGRSQYDLNSASCKIFRHTGEKWSRQSEEIPISRILDLTLLFLSVIDKDQNENAGKTILSEEWIAKNDIDFLKNEIAKNNGSLKPSLVAMKEILKRIDIDNV